VIYVIKQFFFSLQISKSVFHFFCFITSHVKPLLQFTFIEMYENLSIQITCNMNVFIVVVVVIENTEETTNEYILG